MWAVVVGESDGNVHLLDLILEQVLLVEEEHYGDGREPFGVADLVEELERLVHAVRLLVLIERQIVLGQSHEEEDGRDILEAVDPLLTLGALTSDVDDAIERMR